MSKKNKHKNYRHGSNAAVAFQNKPIDEESPQEERKTKAILDEISVVGSLLYKGIGMIDYNPDELAGKKGLQIYSKMREDDQIKAVLTMKKMAMLSTNWDIFAASENAEDVEKKDFIKWNLDNLEGTLEDYLWNIFTAYDFGFSLSELVYYRIEKGRWAGKIGLKSIKTREPFYYGFDSDIHGNLRENGIIYTGGGTLQWKDLQSQDNLLSGSRLPVKKFVIYSYQKEFGNWYGRSDLRSAYRSYFSKDVLIRFHNIYMERFGMPTHIGTVPRGTSKADRDDLRTVLDKVQAKYAIVIPEDIKIDLLRAESGGAEGYARAIEMHNKFMARSILVPDLMGYTEMSGGGAYALGKKHFDMFLWIIKKGHRDSQETIMGEQVIKRLIDMNWMATEDYPQFRFESVTEEGSQAKATIVAQGLTSGFINPREPWIRGYLGLPPKPSDIELPEVLPPGQFPRRMLPIEVEERIQGLEEKVQEFKEFREGLKRKLMMDWVDRPKKTTVHFQSKENKAKVTPSQFTKKMDYVEVKQSLDDYQDDTVDALSEIITEMRDDLVHRVRRKKIVEDKDLAAINKLQVKYIGDFKRELEKRLIKLYIDGKLESAKMLNKGGVDIEIVTKFQSIGDWEPVPPVDAIDFFKKKVLVKVKDKEGKRIMINMLTGEILDYYTQKAFYIAGVEKEEILKQAKAALLASLKKGDSVDAAMFNLGNVFDEYIKTGELNDKGELTTAHRLETIVRTNYSEAFNRGIRDFVDDNDITDFVPYLEWSAILDDRVRETHAEMDGKIFREDDPDIEGIPPAGFQCRCFPYDVHITTSKGKQWIRKIKVGDLVWTHKGRYRKVTKVHSRIYKGDLIEIKYGSYHKVSMTPEHPVYIWRKGWVEAKNVKYRDKIKTGKKRKYNIICISKVPFEGAVYNLSVEDDESYVAGGIIVHNCTWIPITSVEIDDLKAKGEGVKVSTKDDFPPDFPDLGFKSFSEDNKMSVLSYQEQKKERIKLIINDRYNGNLPDPETMCHGQCEGTGAVPIKKDDMQEPFRTLWLEAEKEKPSEDGWHFVKCPDCNGTGINIKSFIRLTPIVQ